MGFYFVDSETYEKYKDEVLFYSQSVQVNTQEFLPEDNRKRPLSDKEIAVKMGLDERVVREIRQDRPVFGHKEIPEEITR